jgi:SdrD B-like protein
VFRDENINGAYNSGEPGLAGVVVALDDTRTVKTDSSGHYKFTNVSQDEHRIAIALSQFTTPVRMTTSNEFTVNLAATRSAGADFGIVNFARLMGSIYNDLRFEGKRQSDSVPIGDVHLLLTHNGELMKTIAVPGSGEFEMTDVPPGDYDLAVDVSTVPPDYTVPVEHTAVHVEPVSSVAVDIPLRAMRSIAGHVYLKVVENPTPEQKNELNIETRRARRKKPQITQAPEPTVKLVPLVGVQLTADHTVVKSDENGAFILRNLPAGDLTVTLVPVKPLPAGMKVPAGFVHLPAGPIRVENATIVISNPDLVPYLTDLNQQQPAVIAGQR